ncbi:ABC transporter substrate-binding protein [Salinadaptatus halalkaliphilus]|uniref:ABC transporter substrate-binding protein n=1 Tax=Salinadaptatus halalkaliphilus TaxID=2419781 RepID=A0A4S3TSS8_9EURY|nr:ABC transporter substrate-binding protein [Salinadaptatus halalkaliphilus]THE65688.1 ABC transporter substrate-binding protein [Salinadaptatus halalkaliphilus]
MVTFHHGLSRRQLLAAGASVSAATIAGCIGGNGEDDDAEILDPEEYDYDRDEPDDEDAARQSSMVYTQELERDEDFDPVVSNDAYSFQIITLVFDSLYEFDYEYELQPKVAVDFPDVERDDTRFIYEIHDGIEFHNGEELTASDVAHSFRAPVEEETPNMSTYDMIEEIDVIDDYQLQVDLAHQYGSWELFNQAVDIVPEDARTEDREEFNENPIGSGPFEWHDFQFGEYVELERFDDYWDEPQPYMESIRFEDNVDDASRVSEMLAHDTDAIGDVPNDDWGQLEDEDDIDVHVTESPSVTYIFFNTNEGAGTADPNVRRGIAHAFSLTDYVETYLNNAAIPLVTPTSRITNDLWEFPIEEWDDEIYPEYDPELAEELLDEHAPDDWNPTFMAPDDERATLAERVATRLDEIGYDMEVQTMDFGAMLDQTIYSEADPDNYELYILGWTGGPDPDQYLYSLFHESQEQLTNGHHYDGSDDFHDTIVEARETADQAEREQLYTELIEEVLTELPALPAYTEHNSMATGDHVRDMHVHPQMQYNPHLVSEESNVWIED